MASVKSELDAIVGRVRRTWGYESVEAGGGSKDYVYRVICPDGYREQLHGTPSDGNWEKNFWNALNKHGFAEAEQAMLKQRDEEKARRLAEEREASERLAQKLASQATMLTRAAGSFAAQPADPHWVLSKHDLPETKRLLVGPQLAAEILEKHNTGNRKLLPTRVTRWMEVMKSGEWGFTHQGIAFDVDAVLQDGQNRLAAAAELGYTMDILVSVGMPKENFTRVDSGVLRTASETAYLLGHHQYASTYSGAARLILLYQRFGPMFFQGNKSQRISNGEIAATILSYGASLEEAVEKTHEFRKEAHAPTKCGPIPMAAAYYLFTQHDPENKFRDKFFADLSSGTQMAEGNPVLATRTFFSNLGARDQISVPTTFAILIKTWNAYVSGRNVQVMRFTKNEAFPAIRNA